MNARYEPRRLDDGGYEVWDNKRGRRVEQPDLRDSHWFPTEALAEMWIARQEPAGRAGHSPRKSLQSGTSSASATSK